jgi:hypothetical protein
LVAVKSKALKHLLCDNGNDKGVELSVHLLSLSTRMPHTFAISGQVTGREHPPQREQAH